MSAQGRIVFGAAALVAAVAGFWFVAIAPKRAAQATTADAIVQAQVRRDAAVAMLSDAEHARSRYMRDYATVSRLGKAVPADDDIASLVFQLETIARAHKVDFRAVKLTGVAAPPAAPAGAGTPGTSEEGGDPTAPAAPAAPVVAQPPPGAVVGSAGLLTVPFTFTFDGGYMKLQRFLKAIDGLANGDGDHISVRGRLLTVDGFSLMAGRNGYPKLKALVSATAYLAPKADGVTAGASPQGPAAASASPTATALITPDAEEAGR